MSDKKLELSQPVAIVLAGVIIAAAVIFTRYYQPTPVAAEPALPGSVSVGAPSSADHIVGSPNAPVVLIEYSDFQCPYCSVIHATLKRVVSESNGKVAWIMRSFPLSQIHPEAGPAALAAECIAEQKGNAGFWQFADTVFANQSTIGSSLYTQIAKDVGANIPQYQSCVTSKKYQAKLDSETAEAQAAGGQGTPFTVVYGNGKQVPVSGALPYAQIMAVIQSVSAGK